MVSSGATSWVIVWRIPEASPPASSTRGAESAGNEGPAEGGRDPAGTPTVALWPQAAVMAPKRRSRMGPTCFRRLNSTNIFLIRPLHGLPLFLKPRFNLSLCGEILHPLSLQKKRESGRPRLRMPVRSGQESVILIKVLDRGVEGSLWFISKFKQREVYEFGLLSLLLLLRLLGSAWGM